ncbi:MFS transporter [Amorphus orientalis]|uniref:MFS family permease n=1 Tax=Amorphus orientalis TaxID=649198 RepID=A0AAE3VQB9_9HYPH|nr:MFS transporter [Amorphus orientalis]MDQ0315895.1 MFS family permease [Amorphus orientalis]
MTRAPSQTGTVISLGTAQTLAWGSTYYLPAILAGPMAADLGLSTGWVFAAFSATLILSALVGPAAGRRIDTHGGRDVLALSNLVFAAGLCLLAAANEPVLLFAGWIVIGIGMAGGLYEAAFSTLTGIYGRSARGAITGITLIAGLASTICWPISAYLDAELGWRTTCLIWAAAHILIGLPLNRFLVPAGGTRARPHTPDERTPAAAVPTIALALLAFVFAATWFSSTAMAAHLPTLLRDAGASPAAAIAAASLIGPAQVAGRLLEFACLRRFHPLSSAKIAATAHPIGVACLLTFGAPVAMLFTALHGAGNGILTIAKGTLPLAVFGPNGYGFRQGLLMVPARFAQAAAPFAFALLVERYGVEALLLTAFLGIATLLALSAMTAIVRSQTA